MSKDKVRAYFEQSTQIADEEWEVFAAGLIEQNFKKKKILLAQGATERYLSFVESGIVRLYVPGEDNDLTFGFAFEQSFVSAYDSFLTQSPSSYCIEALTATTLWRISYADLQQVYKETRIGNLIGRYAGEAEFLKKAKRELSFLCDSAEERYLKLFEERPEVIKMIPLKYIASYIGVTPQALSRMRKRIS